jgi:hypothetical protein
VRDCRSAGCIACIKRGNEYAGGHKYLLKKGACDCMRDFSLSKPHHKICQDLTQRYQKFKGLGLLILKLMVSQNNI